MTDQPTDRPTGAALIRLRAQGLCVRCRWREPKPAADRSGVRELLCEVCQEAVAKEDTANRRRRRDDAAEQIVIEGYERE